MNEYNIHRDIANLFATIIVDIGICKPWSLKNGQLEVYLNKYGPEKVAE